MKNLISIIFAISLLPVALPCITNAADATAPRYVQVTGEGEIQIEPDQVILSFGIITKGLDLNKVKDDNATRTKALLDQLKKMNVKDKDVRTDWVDIGPRYDYVNGRQKFTEYVARKNFTVTLNDIASYGNVLQAALDAGVEYVGGVRFETTKQKDLENETRKLAVTDARKKAETLATPLGQKVGRPLSIEDNSASAQPPMFMRAKAMSMNVAGAPEDQLAAGQITVRSNVMVRFELE